MKMCLYSPYIPDHVGGGEKYLFDVARTLAEKHQVFVAIPVDRPVTTQMKQRYQQFLNDPLNGIEFINGPLGTSASFAKKLLWTKQFDCMYYATDGSLFFSLAKKNILHIQFPLRVDKSGFFEQLKLSRWQVKNTNSEFTKSIVEPSWPVKIDFVHHPLVELGAAVGQPNLEVKEKIILNVGRFFRQLHSKRQDILVDVFRRMLEQEPAVTAGWRLVLIGNVEDEEYASEVQKMATSLPIEVIHSVSRQDLIKWYQRATFYWHAAGFGVDEEKYPEKVEHFGISTAEAMLAGCMPLVVGKGGQLEVVGSDLAAWTWQTEQECVDLTLQLIKEPEVRQKLQHTAYQQALQFDKKHFDQTLWSMVE